MCGGGGHSNSFFFANVMLEIQRIFLLISYSHNIIALKSYGYEAELISKELPRVWLFLKTLAHRLK